MSKKIESMSRTMKDSGIPWIGEIPEGWKVKRLKDVGYLYGGLTGKSGDDFIDENEESCNFMRFIPFTNIYNNFVINPNQLYKVRIEKEEKQNLVNKNDILFLMSSEDLDGIGKPAIIEFQEDKLGLNSFCKGFRVIDANIYPKYLFYLLISHVIRELIRQEAKGFIRINLRQDKLSICPILLPPLAEQHLIATFLDKKCSEIDSLIELQEQMIEELKAYKQSVITEAVTKGIRNEELGMRNGELGVRNYKDSGIECIGKIPTHWEVKLLRFVLDNLDYLREPISAEHRQRNNPIYDYYGASGVIDKIDYYNVDDTVLLIGEDGANLRMRNIPLIYKASGKFWVNNHAHILKPISDNYNYLAMLLEALDYSDFITGSAQPKLSQDNLKKVRLCIPPLAEQQAIADYLDKKCGEIDELITIKQQKIESLKEYKKSVIYEYVTGKREA